MNTNFIIRAMQLASCWLLASLVFLSSCHKDSTPAPAPVITAISQNPISPGGAFNITGENFSSSASSNVLKFGSTVVTVQTATKTSLTATLPPNFAPGSYVVTVTVNGHTATLENEVDVTPDAPSITSFTPVSGAAGTVVTITGTNFSTTAANNTLKLGDATVTVTNATATSVTFTVPDNTVPDNYTLHVTVKVNNESSTTANSATGFDVLPSTPAITSIAPTSAAPGASVTITGTNFSTIPAENIINVRNTGATVTASSATSVTFTVPAMAPGNYTIHASVIINDETSDIANSVAGLDVIPPTPTITSFAPVTAVSGALVTITGTNFSTTLAENEVTFGTTVATITAATATSLKVIVPDGLSWGEPYTLSAKVTVNSQSSAIVNSLDAFQVIDATDGLVAYYKFAGDTKDYSGHGNDLNPTDVTYVSDHNGTDNFAASFNGTSSQAVSLNGSDFASSYSASISIWFYGKSSDAVLIFYGSMNSNDVLVCSDNYNPLTLSGSSGFGFLPFQVTTYPNFVNRDEWHHLVGLKDDTKKELTLYVDNVKSNTTSFGASSNFKSINWNFGYDVDRNVYWQGYIGKTRIYNKVISESLITALYNE